MQGKNTFIINKASMRDIMQLWVDSHLLGDFTVESLLESEDGSSFYLILNSGTKSKFEISDLGIISSPWDSKNA